MKKYLTIQGDTWDAISYRVYGSEFYTNELFNANPELQQYYEFSANIYVNIPDVDVAINSVVAPWLRADAVQAINNTELLDIVNSYSDEYSNILSYRMVSKFNKIVTESSFLNGGFADNLLYRSVNKVNDKILKSTELKG